MSGHLVIFDLGATLVDGPPTGPANRIAARAGLDKPQKRQLFAALMARSFAGPADVLEFLESELGMSGPSAEEAVLDVWQAQTSEAPADAGPRDVLNRLAGHGYRIAIISNIWVPYLQSVRRHLGAFIDEHVRPELRLFSFLEGHPKPAPVMFARVLAAAGVDEGRAAGPDRILRW